MVRRSATVLPLALGATVVAGGLSVAIVVTVSERHELPPWFPAIVWSAVIYSLALAIQLAAFTVHTLLYALEKPPLGAEAVVVLGCGLNSDGSVTPLLASRLDRAREVMAEEIAAGHRPALVVSGGQGSDETVPEAVAMQRYLLSAGYADEDVLVESSSRTTHENLVLSAELLTARGIDSGPMVVVTSDFHVLRTATFTRDLGLDARVTGAWTARFSVPTAFLREFIAVLRRYWKPNAVVLLSVFAFVVVLQNVN